MKGEGKYVGRVTWLHTESSQTQAVIPEATGPFYSTVKVDDPIRLWSGSLEILQKQKLSKGFAVIRMVWPPRPDIAVSVRLRKGAALPGIGQAEIWIPSLGARARATVDQVSVSGGRGARAPRITCSLSEDLRIGPGVNVASVVFHLPNFRQYIGLPVRQGTRQSASRAVLEAAGWRVVLDQAHHLNEGILADLQQARGYAITHVGRLERVSGEIFDVAVLPGFMNALGYFLSFCQGNWVAPILSVGMDRGGGRIWEEWGSRRVERWAAVNSWLSEFEPHAMGAAFPGFIRRWHTELWQEPLRLAMHWYVESNRCAGGVEGALVLAQVAFELLTWTLLVEERKALSKKSFKGTSAGGRLRMLLETCGLDTRIPDSLSALVELAGTYASADGPGIITHVRNETVHPEPSAQKAMIQLRPRIRYEAWRFALWYLELILLRLFDYEGKYSSRVNPSPFRGGELEAVHWASGNPPS